MKPCDQRVKTLSESELEISDAQNVLKHQDDMENIVQLVGSSWEDPSDLLKESFQRISRIAIVRNSEQKIIGFQGWSLKLLQTPTLGALASAYIGLGSVDSRYQGKGVAKLVVYGGIRKAAQELGERFPGTRSCVWTTTISPIAYLGLLKGFPNGFLPSPDGTFSTEVIPLLSTLKAELGATTENEDNHPYILRKISKKRYLPRVTQQNLQVISDSPISIFHQHNLNEREGDRLILLLKP